MFKNIPGFKCFLDFSNASLKLLTLPDTIKPAAAFKATASENSLEVPLNISIIFKELYSAFLPFKLFLSFKLIPSSLGFIVNSIILIIVLNYLFIQFKFFIELFKVNFSNI